MNKYPIKAFALLFLMPLLFICTPTRATDAVGKTIKEIIPYIHKMREIPIYGYDYTVDIKYPTKQTEKIQGSVYMDWANKQYYDKNKYSIAVINPDWSYRSDLKRSIVSITNLKLNKNQPGNSSNDMFNKDLFAQYSDTLLHQYAKVLEFTNVNDIVTIKLEFSEGHSVNQWHCVYDFKKKTPLKMYVKILSGSLSNRASTELYCSKFKTQLPKDIFSTLPYFEVKANKVILKQYKTFKINSNF